MTENQERPRRRREHREEGGDDPLKHARILQHRWQGSPPPTAERYARALRQWRALPGAVVAPGTGGVVAPGTGGVVAPGTGGTAGVDEGNESPGEGTAGPGDRTAGADEGNES